MPPEEAETITLGPVQVECGPCRGTGLYIGMGEGDGAAVVCYHCKGTGCQTIKHTYKPFTGRKVRGGVLRVFERNPGFGIGRYIDKETGQLKTLSDFGGLTYEEWLRQMPFARGSEMRMLVCPCWWMQLVGKVTPNWSECCYGSFQSCALFGVKHLCWLRHDKEKL